MYKTDNSPVNNFEIVRKYPVITFFVITFLIGFGFAIPLYFTDIPSLALIAASSSSIAGIITAILYGGKDEVKNLFLSLLKFKCGVSSYIWAIVIPTAIVMGAIFINLLSGNPYPSPEAGKWVGIIPTFLFVIIQAGLGEEIGWRGFALPKLSNKKSHRVSSLIIGVVWACWHIPLYFFPGFIQHDISREVGFLTTFVMYSSYIIASSIIYSWLYLRSGKSLIPPILIHGTTNVWGWYFNYKDIQSFGGLTMMTVFTILWIGVALIVYFRSPYFNKKYYNRLSGE